MLVQGGLSVKGVAMRLAGLAALVAVGALAPACRAAPGAEPSGGGARLVSLHDVTTEALVAMGATSRLVGVAELVSATAAVRSAVARVRRVASAESILALAPTAVVGLAVVGEQDPELVATLRRRGVDVYLGSPRTLDDVYEVVRAVGGRARELAGAERVVASARARAAALLASTGSAATLGAPITSPLAPAAKSAGARRLFVYDCCDPPFTAGGETVLSDLIARAGARNIFADLPAAWAHVSWEAVIARAPDVILIDDYAPEETGAAIAADQGMNAGAALARKRAALAAIPSLARLPMVALPLGLALGGLGSLDGLERLRAIAVGGAG